MQLEERLDVRLLNRTNHALSRTEQGKAYFERSKSGLDEPEVQIIRRDYGPHCAHS
jgi:DNA-binding transcriptional LysR family regulator